ncbi:MAG: AbrB/MazE/SpoVT family DNA-binding domain-containing protein [Bryobacteraceae bacterium]
MKVGERGQVTIPKPIRDQFGIGPDTEVEFHVEAGSIILRRTPRKLDLDQWKGHCRKSFAQLGYASVDEFIEDVRGR